MRAALLSVALAALALLAAAPAQAVQLEGFEVAFRGAEGEEAMTAGRHPDRMRLSFDVAEQLIEGKPFPVEAVKDLTFGLPVGFTGIPAATRRCTAAEFLFVGGGPESGCPDSAAVGRVSAAVGEAGSKGTFNATVFNMQASPGYAAKLGFRLAGVYITVDLALSESPPYRLEATLRNISQVLEFFSSETTIEGAPTPEEGGPAAAFLVNPRACEGPLASLWQTTSWEGVADSGQALTRDVFGSPRGFEECAALPFAPSISSAPGTKAASSPSGLDFSLDTDQNEGLSSPDGTAAADIEKTVVTLPRGMTINPSQAEGLEVCSEEQLALETSQSEFGAGCPAASKIGTIEVETPLLPEELFKGTLFVAEPYRNPFGTLIALYVVIKDPALGVKIVQPLKVVPDPVSGQLVTYAEEMPQLPFSHFRLHFREGGRAPLITPPGCGEFTTTATLYPYSGGAPVVSSSSFQLISGPDNSPCRSGSAPFDPEFEAGTLNNAAGRYSPFDMWIGRADGEQDITKFSATLPPGVLGKLAGVAQCPESGIAQAKSRTGEHGGTAELNDPSCPAASRIGSTIAGAGVGSQLTYVKGSLYLAGPYNGDPLSVVSITPAVAGPFDAGTVLVRVALRLNPVTGQAEADGQASDPIPHILQGIPLNVRDLRVDVDAPQFTLNATSCEEEQTEARLFGGGTVLAPLPDHPVDLSARYQAASCASLGFKPKLRLRLRGGTRRGAHPALRAVVTPRPFKDANFARAVVKLPRSAFLDQGHIRTVCTRVQFAAGPGDGAACPKGSVYGHAKAWSPLLEEPLQGPVFLRSSSHNLPDLVVALHGIVDIELAARIDSVHGGIRSTFAAIPDAPVSRFILAMQGGKKGLIVNSRNLCFKPKRNRALANLSGQNGKRRHSKPLLRPGGCKKPHRKRHRGHRRG